MELLTDLRGAGFVVTLSVNGVIIQGQKVIALENGVVYTVNPEGVVQATRIDRIQTVSF